MGALKNNTELLQLYLRGNGTMSYHGQRMLLKLVNDVSSIKATLQSNHTLRYLSVKQIDPLRFYSEYDEGGKIQDSIEFATMINRESDSTEKVVSTQLRSLRRARLCRLQGVEHSVYREIDPLHLPEVLSLIGERFGQEELYIALLSSIMSLFSTMNRERCIQEEKEYHAAKAAEYAALVDEHRAKIEELENELAAMRDVAGMNQGQDNVHSQANKRRRT